MDASELALVAGMRGTRGVLVRWNRDAWGVVRPWAVAATAIAGGLLLAVWAVARFSTPDPTPVSFPGLTRDAVPHDVVVVLWHNSLVLALHAMACVAGFIAGSSLPREAERYRGVVRVVHDHAGPLAIGFVGCATAFSLATQAYVLGSGASTLAAQGGIGPALLLVGLLPHAVPELIALFLPLAAWLRASRRGAWDELLAATFVTTGIAVPMLVLAALVEVYVSPHVVMWLRG